MTVKQMFMWVSVIACGVFVGMSYLNITVTDTAYLWPSNNLTDQPGEVLYKELPEHVELARLLKEHNKTIAAYWIGDISSFFQGGVMLVCGKGFRY
jgi:hypothetical protein